jgi:hypothetical protein
VATIGPDVPRSTTGAVTLEQVALLGDEGPTDRIALGQPFEVAMTFLVNERVEDGVIELGLSTADGTRVATVQNVDAGGALLDLAPGRHEIRARFDATTLLPGEFTIDVGMHRLIGLTLDFVEQALTFTAVNTAYDGGEDRWPWAVVRGALRPATTWTVDP